MTAKQALKHKWFKKSLGKSKTKSIQIEHVMRLRSFQKMKRMRKAILSFLASRVSSEDIETQLQSFHGLDKNKDGYITMKELQKGLKSSHSAEEIQEIMDSVDTDWNGAIDYNEFIAATLDVNIAKNLQKLDMAFKFFDKNGDGVIDQDDMKEALTGEDLKYVGSEIIKGIIQEWDVEKAGSINYKEFLRCMSIYDPKSDVNKDSFLKMATKKKIDSERKKKTIGKSFIE